MPAHPIARMKLDEVGMEPVFDAIANGESLKAIAKRLGTVDQSLIRWIESDPVRSARAWEARRISAWHWDEEAYANLKNARTTEQITRAREMAAHLRWRAAKINSRYADKVDVHHTGQITLEALITKSLAPPTIEHDPTDD